MEKIILPDRVKNFHFDSYYKELGEKIKTIKDQKELEKARIEGRKYLQNLLKLQEISLPQEKLKTDFLRIIMDDNSPYYLWLFNSKYRDTTYQKNCLDGISTIFEKSNRAIRGGINTYKINGWMTHVIYVYQIIHDNIANNKVLENNKEIWMRDYINEKHKIYIEMTDEAKFILRIFTLIHDIGVVESIKEHPQCGEKYVEKILKDIGLTEKNFKKYQIDYPYYSFKNLMKIVIRYHIMYSLLSSEGSDAYIEKKYQKFVEEVTYAGFNPEEIATILYLFTFADMVGVNESIFTKEKAQRLKEAYQFLVEIIEKKPHKRNKREVAVERFNDFLGRENREKTLLEAEKTMQELKINSSIFWNNLYEVEVFSFISPLMKQIEEVSLGIELLNTLMVTIERIGGSLEHCEITWIPNNKEMQFIESVKNGNLFRCLRLVKQRNTTYIYKECKIIVQDNTERICLIMETIDNKE